MKKIILLATIAISFNAHAKQFHSVTPVKGYAFNYSGTTIQVDGCSIYSSSWIKMPVEKNDRYHLECKGGLREELKIKELIIGMGTLATFEGENGMSYSFEVHKPVIL